MKFDRNNLDKSSSPYLLQHSDNPIWWQEWGSDVINHAAKEKKPLFVSIGYSTCHWCHVMASEAFSDEETAHYLNRHFLCIKIDREQRPDIDQFMMEFITRQNGSGGWPLNVFLTPDIRPVYALTYAPANINKSSLSFLEIAQKVYDFIMDNYDSIPTFNPGSFYPDFSQYEDLVNGITRYFDHDNGGFGHGQKFPYHSTLLFLLYTLSTGRNDTKAGEICKKTLDAMILRGLNDHLQGGIFRYCVDPHWTIPHFEKMLYDQAMALWVYSLAFRVFGDPLYKSMAEDIMVCLEETFYTNGLYLTAHDADTGHVEGQTYLWNYEELRSVLTSEEFVIFSEYYDICKEGNFDGKNHLIRKISKDARISDIEIRLLEKRRSRIQPSRDDKIQCGLNALTAVAFIQASRNLERHDLEIKAASLVKKLIEIFWDGKILSHSYYNGTIQKQSFLFDSGALLTAISMLYESDVSWNELMQNMACYVDSFKEGNQWIESRSGDFPVVNAAINDHPVPSGISLAVMGIARMSLLKGGIAPPIEFRQSLHADFYNIACMITQNYFHLITSEKSVPWFLIPANSLQMRGNPESDCFMGVCNQLKFKIEKNS